MGTGGLKAQLLEEKKKKFPYSGAVSALQGLSAHFVQVKGESLILYLILQPIDKRCSATIQQWTVPRVLVPKAGLCRAGTRGGQEGKLPWVQWFIAGMEAT